jgi:hypothetical protein
MSLALVARRARLLALRSTIDANGGGAAHLHSGSMTSSAEEAPATPPLCIVALAATSYALHATEASMSLVPVQGFAAVSGQPTFARLVDGAGNGVALLTAGPPGSGAQLIVTDGQDPPSAQMYVGGEVNLTHTFTEA